MYNGIREGDNAFLCAGWMLSSHHMVSTQLQQPEQGERNQRTFTSRPIQQAALSNKPQCIHPTHPRLLHPLQLNAWSKATSHEAPQATTHPPTHPPPAQQSDHVVTSLATTPKAEGGEIRSDMDEGARTWTPPVNRWTLASQLVRHRQNVGDRANGRPLRCGGAGERGSGWRYVPRFSCVASRRFGVGVGVGVGVVLRVSGSRSDTLCTCLTARRMARCGGLVGWRCRVGFDRDGAAG
ncbi:hypothetical protein IWX90DRAFT_418989 [Phyllosticta citrichinensis]|uniref:Uncharacterized protein n=1 Tax=Phyllosticta citrichinensis TaxID=1130410 RepID=A0ABR1XFX1_9PEZI